jgi:hypothetical protein
VAIITCCSLKANIALKTSSALSEQPDGVVLLDLCGRATLTQASVLRAACVGRNSIVLMYDARMLVGRVWAKNWPQYKHMAHSLV